VKDFSDHPVLARLKAVLDPVRGPSRPVMHGDGMIDGDRPSGKGLRPAAVLAPLVVREDRVSLIFTRRADHLQAHPGQISFPGGRQHAGREQLHETALRETEEEIGIGADRVTLLGRFDPYETITGFSITPFVGVVAPGFTLTPDPGEVAEVFEAPFDFLMDPKNHRLEEVEFRGRLRRYYAMPHQGRYIWGATAGMLKALSERLARGR
jgi:8-oxo-dGTP pyrophosphatase MutT (NUDIX family)